MKRLMITEALVGLIATVIFLLLPALWGLYALPFFMPMSDGLTFIDVAFILNKTRKELAVQ